MATVGLATETNSALGAGFPVSGTLVTVEQNVNINATGATLFYAEQTVGIYGSGTLVTLEQEIIERIAASGSLVNIEQTVRIDTSGSLITVEQFIKDSTPVVVSKVDRFGWDLIVIIDGVQVPDSEIHGNLNITRRESNAALMDMTLITPKGVQDLGDYHGKSITVDLITANGIGRIYTGAVDIPEVDLINGLITLRCTDKRKEQINSQFAHRVASIGKWSDHIFDEPVDTADELTQRLKTTTTTVDFDAYGNYTVSDYLPKTSADITLDSNQVYRRKPSIQVASRGRLTNRVNLEYTYQYTRLRHRELPFELTGGDFCDVMGSNGTAYKFVRVQSVPSTVDSTSYKLKPGSLAHTYLPEAGQYTCRNYFTGAYYTFVWSPVATEGTTQQKLDSNGNPVLDSSGNPVYEFVNRTVTDYTKAWSTLSTWVGAKKFAQNVQEKISIEINAPQSQLRFGVVEKDQKNGHRVEYEASEFEKNDSYSAPDSNMINVGSDWYRDEAGNSIDYLNGLATAVEIAKATIVKSHRANIVTFETPIRHDIDLRHTLRVNTNRIDAIGKVADIKHSFNMSTREAGTTVSIAFSQSDNSPPSDSLSIDLLGVPLLGDTSGKTVKIYATEAAGKPSGGSIGASGSSDANTEFNVPAIDDASRDEQLVESSFTYDIPIPNDALTVTFL